MSKTIIVWLRNDLRIRDNETLSAAVNEADFVIPVYCFDPRHFDEGPYKLRKTGKFRSKFLIESLKDLRFSLKELGGNLVVTHGKPEQVIFALAKYHEVSAVYCQEEVCSEELKVDEQLERNLGTIGVPMNYFWGSTLFHFDDLPFEIDAIPNVFTQFKNKILKFCTVRAVHKTPERVHLPAEIDTGSIPELIDLGFEDDGENKGLKFKGGETEALLRMKHYFWESDELQFYKEKRNGLLGMDYSSKFSPYLALGSISPRLIYEEVKKYETQRVKNDSTYWLVFELLWRDYFRFISVKYGNDLFKSGGIKRLNKKKASNKGLFVKWQNGNTGIPFIDANMIELKESGFMSNRGRQNVASFLVKDLQVDWRMGAAHFESLLIDYDPCSNYANWNYIAGIGNDPRENRYFNVLRQASVYDPEGIYTKYWLPELKALPSSRIHQPFSLSKAEQSYLKVNLGKNYPYPCIDLNQWQAYNRTNRKQ